MSDRLKIVYKPISELKEYSNNPRINDDAVKAVKNSISSFGFLVPIVIDRNDIIVAGHTRVKACYELGITDVPCIIADSLTEEQVRAFRLADNKTAEIAEWDYEKLADELNDILDTTDFDMTNFGFDVDSIMNPVTSDDVKDLSDTIGVSFNVIVKCDSEYEQMETYEALTGMGYKCQTST